LVKFVDKIAIVDKRDAVVSATSKKGYPVRLALGFMIVSNLYTTVAYFIRERICARISWGISKA
jgi:hypothetical protein